MPDILLLAEAWTQEDMHEGILFSSASGFLFRNMLKQAGIDFKSCHSTAVFAFVCNDVQTLAGSKAEGIPSRVSVGKGKYINAKYLLELERLYREIDEVKPNIIITLGPAASWAMLNTTGVKQIRGAVVQGRNNVKVLPTWSPSAVARDYTLRPIVVSDLDKARAASSDSVYRKPQRFIHIEPTLQDLTTFEYQHIRPSPKLSIDIETRQNQITCIGFAPTNDRCLVVPIYNPKSSDGNYWRTLEEEMKAWAWIRRMCGLQKQLIFQNGLYDMHFLWKQYGIPCPHATDDTMLLHHALQPEMEKSLGFLASIYTQEAPWKFMRSKHETIKKED
jgi:uracil-DNA glycosylase